MKVYPTILCFFSLLVFLPLFAMKPLKSRKKVLFQENAVKKDDTVGFRARGAQSPYSHKPGAPLSDESLQEYKDKKAERDILRMNISRGRALRNMIDIGDVSGAKEFYDKLNSLEKDLVIYYFYWLERKDFEEKIQRDSSELEMEEEFVSPEQILVILTGGPVGESHFVDTLFRIKAQGLPLHEKILNSKEYRHLGDSLEVRENSLKKLK